jgi:hypothetical protein
MNQPKLFNLNLYERNILISQIQGLEKEQVYGSIPAFLYQNRGWVIKGATEVNARLQEFCQNDSYSIAYNPLVSSYLTVSLKNPEETAINIQNDISHIPGLNRRAPSASRPPLPISDDEENENSDTNGKTNPTLLCFDRAYRMLRTYIIYFTETFIISSASPR